MNMRTSDCQVNALKTKYGEKQKSGLNRKSNTYYMLYPNGTSQIYESALGAGYIVLLELRKTLLKTKYKNSENKVQWLLV